MSDSLADIARELRRCRKCPLSRQAAMAVPGEGPPDADIFFVGQAPGASENRTGRPFAGRAGRFLDRAIQGIGLSRKQVFITSVEKFFPPRNRPPARGEIAACKPFLVRQIAAVDPHIVVLLGRVAERALKDDTILRDRRVLVTVHPAAAMRFPKMRRLFLADMRTIERWRSSGNRKQSRRTTTNNGRPFLVRRRPSA